MENSNQTEAVTEPAVDMEGDTDEPADVQPADTQPEAVPEDTDGTVTDADVQTEDTLRTITADMAYEGINNYCHSAYYWSVAEDNPDIMSVTMGEETDSSYQVIFRSYTGAFVHFYVDKASGTTRMVEKVPSLNVEEEGGTINLFDYLEKQKMQQ